MAFRIRANSLCFIERFSFYTTEFDKFLLGCETILEVFNRFFGIPVDYCEIVKRSVGGDRVEEFNVVFWG